jgi:hypothetical protein
MNLFYFSKKPKLFSLQCSVADPNADPDPDCHFDAEACHLQIDADPDPAYHFDADPDPTFQFDVDPDPDSQHCSLRTPFIPEFSLYKK